MSGLARFSLAGRDMAAPASVACNKKKVVPLQFLEVPYNVFRIGFFLLKRR
jgi:hypothetical protein